MLFVKIFGFTLASGVLLTSIAMIVMGGRFQQIEASAYSGKRRPWWFILISVLLISLYLVALITFFDSSKNWAGWTLILLIPAGWILKGLLVVFNVKGRQKVSSISGDSAWTKVALARLPLALLLALLSYYA